MTGASNPRRGMTTVVAILLALLVSPLFNGAENALAGPQEQLAQAVELYKSARYDDAIDLLTRLVADEQSGIEERKDALRYLGRCYIAKRLTEKAQESIQELLTLEPPLIEFDPDREAPPLMKIYYEARKQKSNGSYELERQDPGIRTMAVIDFHNNSITDREKYQPMEKGFADIMINRLNGAVQLKVVERERLQWILNELEIQDRYNMEGAVRAGKQLGVHTVLLGSYIIVKKEIWLSARLVKVETSEILLTEEVKGKVDKFFELTDELSAHVATAIDASIKLAEVSGPGKPHSNSLEAMLAYSEGLSLLEQSDYIAAHDKFTTALEHDSNYERARLKAESIAPLLEAYASY